MNRFATSRRSKLYPAGAALLSAVALWAAARNTSIAQMRSAMAGANFLWVLPYPVICVALNMLRGQIWKCLLEGRVGSADAFWAYSVGFVANNLLPFRVGEAARVVVLSAQRRLPIVEVAAAASLERLLDLMALLLLVAVLAFSPARSSGLLSGAALIGGLVVLALIGVATLARLERQARTLIERATHWLPRRLHRAAMRWWDELSRGLTVLVNPSIGLPAAAGAIVVWVLTVVLQWLVLRSFQPRAGAADAALMVVAVSLAIALPAAPGFIGVYHWAGQQSLVAAFPHLYDPSTALAAATVAHAVSYVTSTAIGIVGLWYFGIAPSSVPRGLPCPDAGLTAEDPKESPAESLASVAN